MTRHSEFKMETRRQAGGNYANCVQIVCGYCRYEAWYPAKNGGWAMRIFRAHGWKVGSKPAQHLCPKCFGRVRRSNRTPDNPAIPKEIGKAIKKQMMEAHVKDALLGTSSLNRHPEKPVQDPLYLSDLIVPVEPSPPPEPPPKPKAAVRGHKPVPGMTFYGRRDNAARSAQKYTHLRDGIGFYTVPLGEGWTWKLAADTTEAEKAAWWKGRKLGPRPKNDADRAIANQRPITKEEPPMTTTVTPIRKDVMPTQATPTQTADPARQPTRDERALIHDALTTAYDNVDQRYLKDGSDKSLAAKLDVPRAWVTDVRTMFFGDHDRNAETEKHKAALDVAIVLASTATKRLLEMAGEAETLEQGLIAARKKLDV